MMLAALNKTESRGTRGMALLEIVAYARSQKADLQANPRKIDLNRNLVRRARLFA